MEDLNILQDFQNARFSQGFVYLYTENAEASYIVKDAKDLWDLADLGTLWDLDILNNLDNLEDW